MTDNPATAIQIKTGILVVDDEQSIRFTLGEALRDEGYTSFAAASGEEALALLRENKIDLVLLDLRLQASGESGLDVLTRIKSDYPEVEVVMMTAYGRFSDALEAGSAGCYQFLSKPFELDQVKLVIRGALDRSALQGKVAALDRNSSLAQGDVIGESPAFRDLMSTVERVAGRPTTVLLLGETGAGKEVVARAIHRASHVADGPLVEVNCSAVHANLLESELFGHEKGAFTDAKERRRGLFELAHRGTLFLDEIGDMAPDLQAKLLRVLETGSFKRVGGATDLSVQVRIVAATNRDLKQAIAEGSFREDLYYRLAVVSLHIPPLRDRQEDILPLASYFFTRFNREMGTGLAGFSPETERRLTSHTWPGNVRELRNVVERAVLLATGKTIEPEVLPPELLQGAPRPEIAAGPGGVLPLVDIEKQGIECALRHFDGNKTQAAMALGIARGTLRTKIREYGIEDGD